MRAQGLYHVNHLSVMKLVLAALYIQKHSSFNGCEEWKEH